MVEKLSQKGGKGKYLQRAGKEEYLTKQVDAHSIMKSNIPYGQWSCMMPISDANKHELYAICGNFSLDWEHTFHV